MIYNRTKSVFGILLAAMLVVFLCSAEKKFWNSPVKGSVVPTNGAIRAWLFSTTDTLSASVNQGFFIIDNVKPGKYILELEGMPPYRNSYLKDVLVSEGQPTDVGVIQMNQ